VGVLADQLLEHNGDSGGDATGEHIGDASSDLAAGVRADGGEQRGVLGDIYADNGDYAGGLDDFADDFDLEAELALLMDEDVEELEATFSMGLWATRPSLRRMQRVRLVVLRPSSWRSPVLLPSPSSKLAWPKVICVSMKQSRSTKLPAVGSPWPKPVPLQMLLCCCLPHLCGTDTR
jgi:hypothetical protein